MEKSCIMECESLTNGNTYIVSVTNTTEGGIATYTCNTGYTIGYTSNIQSTRTCTSGSWTGTEPNCTAVDCGVLSNPSNGQVSVADTTYGATALYICNLGYDIAGTSTSSVSTTCMASGEWSLTGVTCTIRDCGSLSDPQNGQVSLSEGTTYGATATYTCDPGYIIRNTVSNKTKTVFCSAAGLWTSTEACAIKAEPLGATCPDPATTNLSPKQLCSEDYAFCLKRSTNNTQNYTCQCSSSFYDDNGDEPAGQCKLMSELAVQNIAFSRITTKSMRVSWAPPANKSNFISGYKVYWRPMDINFVRSSNSQVLTNTYFDITYDVESGKAYEVAMESQNTVNYTDIINVTHNRKEHALKPAKPGPIIKESSDLDVEDNVIELTWTASTGTVDYYAVHIFEVGMQDRSIVSNDTSSSHVMMLVNMNYTKSGHRYDVTITAYSQVYESLNRIESEIHREQIKTDVKVPSAPSSVQCLMTSDNSVTIKWEEPATPNGDLIQYRVDTYEYNNQTRLKSENTGDLDLNFEVTGLDPGSYYYFNVFTINELYTSSEARLTQQYCQTKSRAPDTDTTNESSNIVVIVVAVVVPVVVGVAIVTIVILICRRRSAMCFKESDKTTSKLGPQEDSVIQSTNYYNIAAASQSFELTNKMSNREVNKWLSINEFENCKVHFKGYTGKDILKLSKEDLTLICGPADGIRIYNRLRESTSTRTVTDHSGYQGPLYMDLDDARRDGVPYENIEMDRSHLYSALQHV